jgi:acyl-CoA synthetase (AMP-forming)/AMP-acid ligase II
VLFDLRCARTPPTILTLRHAPSPRRALALQVAILDEQCRELPAGQVGEVCIRGPNVTSGYLDNPKANEEAFAGGWFHTGDQGFLDEEGYLTLTGRLKELINRGGEKISPIEVDSALLAHPGVAEAVSFAAPDDKYGEVVAAAVVLNEEGGALGEKAGARCVCVMVDARAAEHAVPTLLACKPCSTWLSSSRLPASRRRPQRRTSSALWGSACRPSRSPPACS